MSNVTVEGKEGVVEQTCSVFNLLTQGFIETTALTDLHPIQSQLIYFIELRLL